MSLNSFITKFIFPINEEEKQHTKDRDLLDSFANERPVRIELGEDGPKYTQLLTEQVILATRREVDYYLRKYNP